MRTAGR